MTQRLWSNQPTNIQWQEATQAPIFLDFNEISRTLQTNRHQRLGVALLEWLSFLCFGWFYEDFPEIQGCWWPPTKGEQMGTSWITYHGSISLNERLSLHSPDHGFLKQFSSNLKIDGWMFSMAGLRWFCNAGTGTRATRYPISPTYVPKQYMFVKDDVRLNKQGASQGHLPNAYTSPMQGLVI